MLILCKLCNLIFDSKKIQDGLIRYNRRTNHYELTHFGCPRCKTLHENSNLKTI